jgi:hypothetical protein
MPEAAAEHGTVMPFAPTIRRMILILAGSACLGACGFLFYKLMPQEGKPPSAWTGTDTKGTTAAMVLLVLLVAGVGMLLKGIFS